MSLERSDFHLSWRDLEKVPASQMPLCWQTAPSCSCPLQTPLRHLYMVNDNSVRRKGWSWLVPGWSELKLTTKIWYFVYIPRRRRRLGTLLILRVTRSRSEYFKLIKSGASEQYQIPTGGHRFIHCLLMWVLQYCEQRALQAQKRGLNGLLKLNVKIIAAPRSTLLLLG
jgi:hypothetical protein